MWLQCVLQNFVLKFNLYCEVLRVHVCACTCVCACICMYVSDVSMYPSLSLSS
jgi:hypothetical protein